VREDSLLPDGNANLPAAAANASFEHVVHIQGGGNAAYVVMLSFEGERRCSRQDPASKSTLVPSFQSSSRIVPRVTNSPAFIRRRLSSRAGCGCKRIAVPFFASSSVTARNWKTPKRNAAVAFAEPDWDIVRGSVSQFPRPAVHSPRADSHTRFCESIIYARR